MNRLPNRSVRFPLAIALLLGSGATAVAHQLLWTRRLTDLLGASLESASRVFGCFFLGLALGAFLGGQWATRTRRPWIILAGAEVGVGVSSLFIHFLPSVTAWIWPMLGPESLIGWEGATVRWVLSALLIVVPASLIGTTLPLAAAGSLYEQRTLKSHGALIYGVYTLGGILGVAGIMLSYRQEWGLAASMVTVLAGNLAVAGIAWVLARSAGRSPGARASRREPTPDRPFAPLKPLLVSFSSGAGIIAIEVIGLQILTLNATLSLFTPVAVLGCVILVLAVAAGLVSLPVRVGNREGLTIYALVLAALMIAASPIVFMWVSKSANWFADTSSVAGFTGKLVVLTFIAIGPAVLVAGAVFPLILSWRHAPNGQSQPRLLGWLLTANGLGGLAGSEAAYGLLLPSVGPYVGMGVVASVYASLSIVLALTTDSPLAERIKTPCPARIGYDHRHPTWLNHVVETASGERPGRFNRPRRRQRPRRRRRGRRKP